MLRVRKPSNLLGRAVRTRPKKVARARMRKKEAGRRVEVLLRKEIKELKVLRKSQSMKILKAIKVVKEANRKINHLLKKEARE